MKKNVLLIITFMLCGVFAAWAQNNDRISYQAVVRDSENHLVYNTQLQITVSLANSETGVSVYSERHTVTSNANGLISLLIGDGQDRQGAWSDIHWNTAWVTATVRSADGQTQIAEHHLLLSAVPYALYADYADSMDLAVLQNYLDEHQYVTEGELPSAQANADWTESNPDTASFIKHKPDLGVYATNEHLNDTLGYYTMSNDVDTLLGDYVTKSKLDDTLGHYVLNTDFTDYTNVVGQNFTKMTNRMDTLLTHVCDSVKECVTGWISDSTQMVLDSLNAYYDTTRMKMAIHDTADVLRTMMVDAANDGQITIAVVGGTVENPTFGVNQIDNQTVTITVPESVAPNDGLLMIVAAGDTTRFTANQANNDTVRLNKFATKDTLAYYATTSALKDSLTHYVGKEMLNDTLSHYTTTNQLDTVIRKYGYVTNAHLNDTLAAVYNTIRTDSTALHKAIKDTAAAIRGDICDSATACITKALAEPNSDINHAIDTIARNNIHDTAQAIRAAIHDSLSSYKIKDCGDVTTCVNAALIDGTSATNHAIDSIAGNVIHDSIENNISKQIHDSIGNITIPTAVTDLSDAGNYLKTSDLCSTIESNCTNVTLKNAVNNFSGKNHFADSVTVPSNTSIPRPATAEHSCTDNVASAVNICDLLAVFDSLSNRIKKLEDELKAMSQSMPATVSIELSDVTKTTLKATASMSNNDLTVSSYEFCISDNSSMNNPVCESSSSNEFTFTGLTPNTVYYATVKAFHTSGNATSDVASAKTLAPTIEFSITPGTPVCLCDGNPTTVTYTANSEDIIMDEYSFSWSVPDGDPQPNNAEGQTCTITYSVAASYTVTCTATLKTNSTVQLTADTTIIVQSCTTPTITTCETDLTVTVMSVTGNPDNIDWKDGTTGTSVSASSTNPTTHTYENPNVYTIEVSKDGCSYEHTVALGDAALYPCTVSAAHTSTTDYTGSSTTPGTGGLETETTAGSNQITHVADQDGNIYPVVQIGSQCWMAKNLRTTHFSDGEGMTLLELQNNNQYPGNISNIPYRYAPALGMEYLPNWGYYYNWEAAMYGNPSQGVCPKGWHLPSKIEWETMATVVNGSEVVFPYGNVDTELGSLAGKLSSGCTWHPLLSAPGNNPEQYGEEGSPGDYNNPDRNASGFSSIPTGWVSSSLPHWYNDNTYAYYWSSTLNPNNSTSAYAFFLWHNDNKIHFGPMEITNLSHSSALTVRCVRDGVASTSYPTLTVTPSTTSLLLCPGSPENVTYIAAVSVNGSTTHEGYSYTWKVTNTTTNTTETLLDHSYQVTIPYSEAANYKVSCVAKSNTTTDSANNSVMTLVDFKVAPSFTPIVSGFTVTLDDIEYVSTVKWTSDGEVGPLPNPATHTYDQAGPYQITAFSAGNCSLTQTVVIEAIFLSASDNISICPNGSTEVTYSATVAGATATGYSWELTSGNTGGVNPTQGTDNPFVVTYTATGTYTYSCTATLEGGGSLSKEITTTITENEAPAFTTCVDGKWLTVREMSNVAIVYWTLNGTGDPVSANATIKSHKYEDNETTYSIKAVSSNGCETTASGDLGTIPSTTCNVNSISTNEQGTSGALSGVKDNDNNWYSVVQIGTQCWMAENLRANVGDGCLDPNYYHPAFGTKLGRWYNRDKALSSCPDGWHIPSVAEWEQMESVVSGSAISHSSTNNYVGTHAGILAGGCEWTNSDVTSTPGNNAQNTYGFRVLPAGKRNHVSSANYNPGEYASFWCSDEGENVWTTGGVAWTMKFDETGTMKEFVPNSSFYISVRCVRDGIPTENEEPGISAITASSMTVTPHFFGASTYTYCISTNIDMSGATCSEPTTEETHEFTGLESSTTYYIQVRATNAVGSTNSDVISGQTESSTPTPPQTSCLLSGTGAIAVKSDNSNSHYSTANESGDATHVFTVKDYNNNVYNVVQIGNRCWLKENMRATNYSDGTAIDPFTGNAKIDNDQQPESLGNINVSRYYYPGLNENNVSTYGLYYTWNAATRGAIADRAQGVCPTGWHVPDDIEWTAMESQFDNSSNLATSTAYRGTHAGKLAGGQWTQIASTSTKTNAPGHPNISSDIFNMSNFSALPAGGYYINTGSSLLPIIGPKIGELAIFWTSSTSNYTRWLMNSQDGVRRVTNDRNYAFSVRCIRDY